MTLELGQELDRHFRMLGVQAVAHDEGVILRRGTTRVLLSGEGVIGLLDRMVDASRAGGLSDVALKQALPREDWPLLDAVMEALIARRLLVPFEPGAAEVETPEEVYYWDVGTTRAEAHKRLAERSVPVIGDNAVSRRLVEMLQASGMGGAYLVDHPKFRGMGERPATAARMVGFDDWTDTREPDRADIFVVCSDFGGLSLMREWNEYCHSTGMAFLPVVLQDHTSYIGPVVTPGSSPCFECLYLRHNSNLDDPASKRATEHEAFFGQHANGYLPPMAAATADFAAMALVKHFSQLLPGGTIGTLVEVDLAAPSIQTHKVLRVPYCPVCSGAHGHPTPAADRVVFMPGNEPGR